MHSYSLPPAFDLQVRLPIRVVSISLTALMLLSAELLLPVASGATEPVLPQEVLLSSAASHALEPGSWLASPADPRHPMEGRRGPEALAGAQASSSWIAYAKDRFLPGWVPQDALAPELGDRRGSGTTGTEELEKLGAWPFGPSRASAFDADRDLLFYATGAAVRTLDLTDPEAPVLVTDEIQTAGLVQAVTFDPENQHLILAEETMGFEIWDVSNPFAPVRLSLTPVVTFGYQAPVLDVEVQDGFAYIAAEYGFFRVFDISDPTNPVDFAYVEITGCREVELRGSLIVVYGNDVGFFQITSPGIFTTLGANLGINVWSGARRGLIAYTVRNGSIQLLDLSDGFLPTAGYYTDPVFYFRDVAIFENYLYASDSSGGIRIFDITDPGVPAVVATFSDLGASQLEVVGNRLNVTRGSITYWLDLTSSIAPVFLAEDTPPGSSCYATTTSGDGIVYAAESSRGLFVLDATDPADPSLLSETSLAGVAVDIEVEDDRVYVAVTFDGFHIVDVSDPFAPILLGSGSVPYYARGIAYSDGYVFVADLSEGLVVYDASTPSAPFEVARLTFPDGATRVEIRGDLAYCGCGSDGLRIVDVSDPTSPELLGYLGGLDYTVGVALSGDFAYLADFGGGMRVVNVSNPSSPALVYSYSPPSLTAWGIDVEGSEAILSAAQKEIYRFDVTTPSSPLLLSTLPTAGDAFEPNLHGRLMDLADGTAGIAFYGTLDPASAPGPPLLEPLGLGVSVTLRGSGARFLLPPAVESLHVYDLEGRVAWRAGSSLHGEVHFEPPRSGVWFWKAQGGRLEQTGRFVTVK